MIGWWSAGGKSGWLLERILVRTTYSPMAPTATLVPWEDSRLRHSHTPLVTTFVASSGVDVGNHHDKEVKLNGVNDTAAPQSKKIGIQQQPGLQGKSVAKKSQQDVNTSIRRSRGSKSHSQGIKAGGDDAILTIPPRSTKKTKGRRLKEKSVIKKSQPDVKSSIRTRKKCIQKECTKDARGKGGVCITHGAKVKAIKHCSHGGCTNQSKKGGVCITHGAKKKRCSFEGCTKVSAKGGVCITHGAKVKVENCSHGGCTNQSKKGGVCITHGAKKKRCSFEGCTKGSVKGGVCITHGAKVKVKRCIHKGCTNKVQQGGVCITHGAIRVLRKRCSHNGCTSYAKKGGVCTRHRSKSSINANNIPTLQPNAFPPSVLPHRSADYEDEEELNSWIWRSSREANHGGS